MDRQTESESETKTNITGWGVVSSVPHSKPRSRYLDAFIPGGGAQFFCSPNYWLPFRGEPDAKIALRSGP